MEENINLYMHYTKLAVSYNISRSHLNIQRSLLVSVEFQFSQCGIIEVSLMFARLGNVKRFIYALRRQKLSIKQQLLKWGLGEIALPQTYLWIEDTLALLLEVCGKAAWL